MRYQGIIKSSLADGTGWRTVLFVSGCNHACKGCHNPETWNPNVGKVFDEKDLELLISLLKRPEIKGLTLSGGDPLFPQNREDIFKLVKVVKLLFPHKDIWLYTGYEWDEIKDLEVIKYVDVVVDGKFVLENRDTTLTFRGSPNQKIIDVKKSLLQNEVVELTI